MKILSLYATATFLTSSVNGFSPRTARIQSHITTDAAKVAARLNVAVPDPFFCSSASDAEALGRHELISNTAKSPNILSIAPLLAALPFLLTVLPAEAAAGGGGGGGGVIPSALVAYGHYVMLLAAMGLLVYERITIQPGISAAQERNAAVADGLYLVTFIAIVATGASRTTDYGKGADFYSHEPFFWVKLALVGVQAGIAAFPALTHLRRAEGVFGNGNKFEPISEKLSMRLHKVLNAEITGLLSIPFLATFMARGVWYSPEFPWQAGAAFTGLALLGSSALYAKQALTWAEDEIVIGTEAE